MKTARQQDFHQSVAAILLLMTANVNWTESIVYKGVLINRLCWFQTHLVQVNFTALPSFLNPRETQYKIKGNFGVPSIDPKSIFYRLNVVNLDGFQKA